jgi:HPt (histidine-containing phosphotransfer) domain-containing protein
MRKPGESHIEYQSHGPRIDLPELLIRLDNDRDLLHELFVIFKAEFPRLVRALQEADACHDLEQVGTVSHTLKGTLASLAITKAAEQASQLESMARARQADLIGGALAAFETEVKGLMSEVELIMAAVRV